MILPKTGPLQIIDAFTDGLDIELMHSIKLHFNIYCQFYLMSSTPMHVQSEIGWK